LALLLLTPLMMMVAVASSSAPKAGVLPPAPHGLRGESFEILKFAPCTRIRKSRDT